ncbi:hypothetical protein ElyMa_004212400 [Elysia marginata]|uniref:Uncharacterized protein n=1 Tax=Elysia marginata TaxID=1093978 RepID=A0AAV4GNB7_9GAST|nr:hypothetical protein ElyMa_004212400 [Elysia marginata]
MKYQGPFPIRKVSMGTRALSTPTSSRNMYAGANERQNRLYLLHQYPSSNISILHQTRRYYTGNFTQAPLIADVTINASLTFKQRLDALAVLQRYSDTLANIPGQTE